jgi:hypothetical protein
MGDSDGDGGDDFTEPVEGVGDPRVNGRGSRDVPGQTARRHRRRVPRERELRVTVEYLVVDGAEGEALERRQDEAIREALEWLHAHPQE